MCGISLFLSSSLMLSSLALVSSLLSWLWKKKRLTKRAQIWLTSLRESWFWIGYLFCAKFYVLFCVELQENLMLKFLVRWQKILYSYIFLCWHLWCGIEILHEVHFFFLSLSVPWRNWIRGGVGGYRWKRLNRVQKARWKFSCFFTMNNDIYNDKRNKFVHSKLSSTRISFSVILSKKDDVAIRLLSVRRFSCRFFCSIVPT